MGFIDSTRKKINEGKEYLKTKKEQLTGEAIEHKIDEYSETYGEILLGMNRELSEMKIKINKMDKGISEIINKEKEVTYSDFQKMKKYLALAIVLSISAITASLAVLLSK